MNDCSSKFDDHIFNLIFFFFFFFSSYSSMSQKRQPDEDRKIGGGNSPEEKRPRLKSVIEEAWKMHSFQKVLSSLEPLVRRVVKEEVEEALRKYLPSMKQNDDNQGLPSTSQSLQLKFNKRLSLPVFTGARIEGEEGSSVEVILFDGLNGEIISSGPESSAKVELVVLEGDFEGDGEDNWTLEEFESNIVKEREGKRPLLNGELSFNLNEGTGAVSELVFTDNSSWTRSRKFKLGARVVDDNLDGVRVREAKTEAFMVKDHRGELYKKHYPPSLHDDVWRLEKIGKDGAFHKRLCRENINTVRDFLRMLWLDAPSLRNILGPGMSTKMWEVTADHARTCLLDNQKYVYYPPGAQQGTGVVFNIVGQAMGLLTEHQFVPIEELSGTEKDDANKLVKLAFQHWKQVVPCDDMGTLGGSLNLPTVSIPGSSTALVSSCVDASFLKPGEFGGDTQPSVSIAANSSAVESSYASTFPSFLKPGEFGGDTQPSVSSSDIVSSILSLGGRSLDNCNWQGLENMDLRYEQPSSFPTQIANSIICDVESMARSFCSEDPLQYFNPETPLQSQSLGSESQSDLGTAVSSFLAMSARTAAAAAIDKAQTRWTMLVSLLRWRFSIKRIVASKKSGRREMARYGRRVIFD